MIVISRNLVLSPVPAADHPDAPLIGWHNIIVPGMLSASSAVADHPVTNVANPATHLIWRAANSNETTVTVLTNRVDPFDYFAVARHNFGSASIPLVVEARRAPADPYTILKEIVLGDNAPVIFRFAQQSIYQMRLRMLAGLAPPEAAVMYLGRLLVMPRRLYVGHTPIGDGLVTDVVNGRSQSGNFLGTVILSERNTGAAAFANLLPAWYRKHMRPFVQARAPFFFAWRPGSYPREVGYGWFPNGHDPRPVNQRSNGMMQISFQMEGVTS